MTRPPPEISLLCAQAGPEQGTISVSDPTAWSTPKPVAARPPTCSVSGRRPIEPSSHSEDTTISGPVTPARMENPRSPGEIKDQSWQALYTQVQASKPYKRKTGMNNRAARCGLGGGGSTARYCNSHGSITDYWGYNAAAEALHARIASQSVVPDGF